MDQTKIKGRKCRQLVGLWSILLLILCSTEFVFSQGALRKIAVEEDGFRCLISVRNQGEQRTVCPSVYYYWYRGGHIFCNQGYFSGCLLHGKYERFDREGRLIQSGWFNRGTKTGKWLSWSDDGVLVKEENWKNGRRSGWTVIKTENGTIRIPYRRDRIEGNKETIETGGKVTREHYRHDIKVISKPPKIKKTRIACPDSVKTGDTLVHKGFFGKLFGRHTLPAKKG